MDQFLRFSAKTILSFIFLLLLCERSYAQDDGFIDYQVIAKMHGESKPAVDALVTIYADGKEFQKLKTDKNGRVKVELNYGPQYKVVFTKAGYVTSYMLLNSKVPEKKKVTISGFKQDVYFIDRNNTNNVDTARYKHPFTKWAYENGEGGFREDLSYLKEFESGIFREDVLAAKEKSDKDSKEKSENDAKQKALLLKKAADKKRREALREEQKKKIKISGKIISTGASPKPIESTPVFLVNDQGKKIETSVTNALGGFAFTKLNPGENYIIESGDLNEKYPLNTNKVSLTNKDGKEEALVDKSKEGKFQFRTLASDKKILTELQVVDAELLVDVHGKIVSSEKSGSSMANLKVNYVDEAGNIIASVVTDADGKFSFNALKYDAVFLFNVSAADGQLKEGEKIVLTDNKGNVIKEITRESKSAFYFEVLPSDENTIAYIYFDDPWLKVLNPVKSTTGEVVKEIIIKESVFFNSNDATLLPAAKSKLNQVISIMEHVNDIVIELSSHSDSKGSDEYNLNLSEKRAKAARDYIISQGISSGRITAKGYGETRLVNKCGNGVECTEEEHAQNRRLEFKVNRK